MGKGEDDLRTENVHESASRTKILSENDCYCESIICKQFVLNEKKDK